jgi:hypothetical protein
VAQRRNDIGSHMKIKLIALASMLSILGCWNAATRGADPPPEQAAAIKALAPVRSNIQLNRDGTVRFVRLSKMVVKDEHLVHLLPLAQLDYLAIVTPTVTDAGLANIANLTKLDTLFLSDSGLSRDGMPHLSQLTSLERLYLDRTKIDDQSLSHLKNLGKLTELSLRGTSVSDNGLAILRHFPSLKTLDLADTNVTDAGLAVVAQCPALESLVLDGCPLSGSGFGHLAAATKISNLSVCRTVLTPTGIAQLNSLPALRQVIGFEVQGVEGADLSTAWTQLIKAKVHLSPVAAEQRNAFQRLIAGERLDGGLQATDPEEKAAAPTPSPELTSPTLNAAVNAALTDKGHQEIESWRQTGAVPDFQKHVVPLFGRLGCNGRACHGSFQGKGGFRLSMFGYDFKADRDSLMDPESPRVDLNSPDDSLLLNHPTSEEHGGGVRFNKKDWQWKLLRSWIANGGVGVETPQKLRQLHVTPIEIAFDQTNATSSLRAIAEWEDGSVEDVTKLARFQTNDEAIATVSPDGQVTAISAGDTWIVTTYDNAVIATQVFLPLPGNGSLVDGSLVDGSLVDGSAETSEIDRLIGAKLNKLRIQPSENSSDTEFLRRVSLDVAGTLPTPEEIRQFVADPKPDKRQLKIDELLESKAYVQWWSMWLSDLTGCNSQYLGSTDMNSPAADQWNAWIHRRVEDNVGWDQIAAGLLLATSRRPGQNYEEYTAEQSMHLRRKEPTDFTALDQPMHYYWFRSNNQLPADRALSFGYVFLGVRLQCAQCHKHPFDQWSKEEFDDFTQFFTRVKTGVAPDAQAARAHLSTKLGVPTKLDTAALRRQMYLRVSAEGLPIPWNEVWIQPPTGKPQPAKILGGPTLDLDHYGDPREPLVAWLLNEDNPYFARTFVNRVWARYMGVGIVDPPDDFNRANPPSNPQLLDWLAKEFVARKYDIRWLHRTITNSLAYQRSWRPTDSNRQDRRNFSHALIRRLPAEVTIDGILQATSRNDRNRSWRGDLTGRKISQHPRSIQTRGIDFSLLVFGKPLRTTNCDCERQMQPTLLQSLYTRNDSEMMQWLNRPDGWLVEVTKAAPKLAAPELAEDNAWREFIDEAYLRTLSRLPSESEQTIAQTSIQEAPNIKDGLEELLWALLNTREFQTNH